MRSPRRYSASSLPISWEYWEEAGDAEETFCDLYPAGSYAPKTFTDWLLTKEAETYFEDWYNS